MFYLPTEVSTVSCFARTCPTFKIMFFLHVRTRTFHFFLLFILKLWPATSPGRRIQHQTHILGVWTTQPHVTFSPCWRTIMLWLPIWNYISTWTASLSSRNYIVIHMLSLYMFSEEFCLVSLSFASLFTFCLTRLQRVCHLTNLLLTAVSIID